MPQPELVAVAAAEEVVLQVEAQVAARGGAARFEAEAGLLGMQVEVGHVPVRAAHRNGRGHELVLVAGRTRIHDRIKLGVATNADQRVGIGDGQEPFQFRIGRAGRTVRARGGR
ncbi:hypothetical protein D9M72_547060 [compost metagenome]